jgi:hypothetical protein
LIYSDPIFKKDIASIVGGRRIRFSGGACQKIAIARAL